MGAIAIHHTATDTESSWDGPAEVAAADNDEGELTYMHAWYDDNGDRETKSTYKFPHHAAGSDTPANINGVDNALARLSQADIPAGDRAGVEAHLHAHRKDAGLEDEESDRQSARAHKAMRVIEGSAQPGEPFWRFVDAAKSESGETEVEFDGPISEYSWFGDEITPKTFKSALYENGKGGPVTVKVNSPGGEVFAAAAIRSILQDYPGKVTADIIGIAASAATVVVGGADTVRMRDTAMFMIHDPSTIAWGTIDEMKKVVEILEQVKETILNGYESKTGLDRVTLARMMADETWMTAQEAKDFGFVDEVVKDGKKVKIPKAVKASFLNCLEGYEHIPEAVSASLRQPEAGQLSAISQEEDFTTESTEDTEEEKPIPDSARKEGEEDEVIPSEAVASAAGELDNEARELRERVKAILGGKSC